ncbi:very short patch repair endonuclease [uncultured Selenomonas sp.]|uniref:very short patch repair endonuclease n=1 Tax=uncultured Selenomonas sp. TaxID=159275 RepID=UPI0026190E91|nr:very short patch repair endonuclease [uncultured Selenomonas sp.]
MRRPTTEPKLRRDTARIAREMDVLSPESRRKAMQSVKSCDTKPEILLRKTLWHKGLRYRKNWRALPGTPDIALTRQKIAVFVDGDFWHARGHEENPGEQIASRQEYWRKKLSRNVERDKEVADALTQLGWLVLRFWESDIKADVEACANVILQYC